MTHQKRHAAASAILALLLFLAPNFVQDFHRILGHHENPTESLSNSGLQINEHHEKCAVCVFEFNTVDDITFFVFAPNLPADQCFYAEKSKSQVQKSAFLYYNLRAPPKA